MSTRTRAHDRDVARRRAPDGALSNGALAGPAPAAIPPEAATPDLLERLSAEARTRSEDSILRAAREMLGMELAYTTQMTDREQLFLAVDRAGDAFAQFGAGLTLPRETSYCHHILAGRLPNLMPDVRAEPFAAAMPVTEAAGVGAYVSVPVRLSSGEMYGTLCCAARTPQLTLTHRDVDYLHVLARLIADLRERELILAERERLAVAAAGMRALVAAVEARDSYTASHSAHVVELATAVARRMGLSAETVAEVGDVALLHDLGKLRVPDAILHKPGPLDAQEWDVMRLHPEQGAEIVVAIPELAHLAPAIAAEHERWDGSGYPLGLAGEAIPVASRITLVCDAYHAMTSHRPYRVTLSEAEARAELTRGAGSQFCPAATAALLAVLAESGRRG